MLDLKLVPEGYTPHYLWDVAVTTGHPADAGVVTLERGASIAGRIEGLRKGAGPVRIQLTPESVDVAADAIERKQSRTVLTTATPRGFFQFRNVAAGSYVVTATASDRSTARTTGITVDDDREHLLDSPLTLAQLGLVTVNVEPPLRPNSQPWIVRFQQMLPFTPYSQTIAEGVAKDGTWRGELEPGQYELVIGDVTGSVHERKNVDIGSGTQTVAVSVESVRVEGRLHAGDEGIEARLQFMSSSSSVTLESDRDGQFSGLLPREGKYNLRILQPRMRRERVVEVKRGDDGIAHLDVALPAGRIAGVVVDSMGNGLLATVTIRRPGEGIVTQFGSDEKDGTFDVRGIQPGEALIVAQAGDAESLQVPVTITDTAGPSVRLVLQEVRTLRGSVVNRTGEPIAGALVRVMSEALPDIRESPTGVNGRFEVTFPETVPSVEVIVVTPGLPTKMVSVPLTATNDDELTIRVGGAPGRLMVRLDGPPLPRIRRDRGMAIPLRELMPPMDGAHHIRGISAEGAFVDLEPGEYTVCGGGAAAATCETRLVAAASVEVVDARPWGKK